VSLQNLIEDYLYDLLPEGIIDLDEQGLIQAVIGGYQDRIDDTRSYVSKLELLVTANGLPETDNSGTPVNNVVLCQVQSPQGKVYNRSLDFQSDTPAANDPALLTWAADQLQLDENHVLISAAYGVDMLRLVDANILGYLAETVGAVLYQTAAMDPDNAQSDARRLLATWFPRLQFKGTAQSFETLGRLLGFDDVRMSPLWGRLSPRIANDIGDPRNNQDFATIPDYFPKQARDNFYDPWVLNDGPFFTWTGTASARFGQSDTRFYTDIVNGFNPFVSVSVVGTAPTDPDPAGAPYILVGGGPEKQASVEPPGSGLLFKAISSGSSFNGLEINFTSIDNGTSRIISITDRLSAIKYRTSYFDLGLTMDFDHALEQFGTVVATANKDLVNNPTSANFGATAVSPFRPWMSGSIRQELITADWITRTNTNGNLTIVSPRVQADLTSRQFDQDALSAAGAQVVAAMEEVRPATRTPRQVNVGYLIEDQVGYAAFCEKDQLFITHSGTSIYSGTITDFPTPPYSVQFQTGTIDMYQEQSITNSGFLTLKTSDLLASGTFDYRNASWILRFPGTVQTGTIVNVVFEPTSTEVVRSNPGTNCIQIGYQERPEDFLDDPAMDMPDEYPWRRSLVGGGELVDLNDYSPAVPDLETIRLGQTASVVSQTGAQYDVQVVVPGPYPPRFVTAERSLDDYVPGQRAIAFSGTFLNLAGTRPSSGTLQGGLDGVMQPGWQLYHFGLVQGVLVADAPKFFGKHHRNGLALWYPFNEQPLDAILVEDHSIYAGNAFIDGLASGDRKFDPVRGNYLAAQPGLLLNSPVARGFGQMFSGGFWIRGLNSYTSEQTILLSGPLKITLSGAITTPRLNFYLTYSDGTVNLKAFQVFDQKWSYFAWSFDGVQTLTVYYWNSTGSLTVQTISVTSLIDFETPYHLTVSCQNSPFDIQDLRLWNVTKAQDELTLARYHNPSPTACLYRPTWLQSVNTYDHYAVKVLPSGYVIPDQLPTSIITDNLAWVQRYDYLARYDAQSRYKETGVGGGNTLPPKQVLGSVWDTLTADGTVAVSTWQGNYPGVNKVWLFDNPSGFVLTLIESGSTISGIAGTLASTGTGSPWPNPLQATNPCRDRIWRKGDDGFVWQISLANTEAGNVSFVTEKIFSLNGSYQPTGAEVELSDATLHKQLSVNTSGVVYSGTYTGTATSAPIYLYANEETVIDLSGTNTVNAWVQPNTFGLAQTPPVVALKNNGQIAFEINNQMLPGFYRLSVTSGNIGKVDTSFVGFNVVITVGDIVFQGKLCADQTGANFSQTDTFDFYLPHTLPGSPSSWLLLFDWSNAIRDNQKGTARQLFISEVNLTRFHTSLYRLTVGAGSVVTTKFGTSGTDYPTTPGGWMATMSSWGTAYGYQHESQIYSSNDTLSNPQPFSNKLTATTSYRTEDIILNGSFTVSDGTLPAFVTYGTIMSPCSSSPAPPTPTCPVFVTQFDNTGNVDGEILMSRNAAVRIIGVTRSNDGIMTFIDSSTNTVLAQTACDVEWDMDGDGSAFAPTTQTFFVTGSAGVLVFDTSGNVVTEIGQPVNSFFLTNYYYSAAQDKIYGVAGNNSDHKIHIIEIDPHTNTITNDVATTISAATTPGVFGLPGQLILKPTNSTLFYALPALTLNNNSFLVNSNFEVDYVPATGLVYFCLVDGSTNPIVSFDPNTYAVVDTFTNVSNVFNKVYVKYNPVSGLIIAAAQNGEVTVIDPVGKTIVCEFTTGANISSIAIDYSSGDIYFLQRDFVTNPFLVYH